MELKKFIDIERAKLSYVETFEIGEPIVCEVKVDGSNASFCYDAKNKTVAAFSRRKQLDVSNTLNGFFEFTQGFNEDVIEEVLGTRYIVFGEWLVKHTVQYPDHMYKKFYMYDVWDRETEQYLPYEETIYFYNKLIEGGITMEFVNTLYIGEFKSWEHILFLLEINTYGEKPCMEGVVIKRQSRLDSRSSRLPYYVKVVNEQFSEVHDTHVKKNIDPEKLKEIEAQKALVAAIVTERRCQKILEKMIEDNIIPADWGSEHMKDIVKNMPKLAFEDCRKEEPELIGKVDNFGKYCSQIAMSHVKKFFGK